MQDVRSAIGFMPLHRQMLSRISLGSLIELQPPIAVPQTPAYEETLDSTRTAFALEDETGQA